MTSPSVRNHAARGHATPWWSRDCVAAAALALLPLVVFLPAALLRVVFYFGDLQGYFYPYHVLPAALIRQGELPLWNRYAFSGIPLLADGQTALFYPPNWLFFVLGGGAALNYDILIQFSIAGVAMYLLLRVFGLWRLPACFGAAAYMFCGCLSARVIHLSILSGAALLPLVLLCVERALRAWRGPAPTSFRARWFVASAVVVCLQAFAGHPQVPVYTAMALGLMALFRGVEYWQDSGRLSWLYRLPATVAGVYLLGIGLAAVQLAPWAELGAWSTRAAGISFNLVFSTSMGRSDWFLQLFPYLYGSFRVGPYADQLIDPALSVRFLEHSAYIGMLPLGLAAYSLLGLPTSRAAETSGRSAYYSVTFFAVLAVLGLLLAMGWATPLAHLVFRLPVVGKLRAVERAMVLVDFAVAGLAAFGLQRLVESGRSPARYRRWSLAVIGAGLSVVPAGIVLLAPHPWFQRALRLPPEAVANLNPHRLNAVVPLLTAFAAAAILLWWSRRSVSRVTLAIAVGLLLLDLGGYAALYHPTTDPRYYGQPPDVLSAFAGEAEPYRKATFLPTHSLDAYAQRALLGLSWGMVYGIEDINGFNSLQTRRYTDYLIGPDEGDVSYGLLGDDRLLRRESPILSSLNVRYLLARPGTSLRVGSGYRRVWENAEVIVYENMLAYPRAFFAGSVQAMIDAAAILRVVTADGFDGRRLALVEAADTPAVSAGSDQDRVTVNELGTNGMSLTCSAASPRFLVLSEMYFPGWQATVDGVPTQIYRTNYLFRGVVVPAGRHTVTFAYRPSSVLIGAGISGLALAVASMILLAGRRSRGRRRRLTPGAPRKI
jgi:hypothetical protein